MRKLRKSVYDCTTKSVGDKHSNVCSAIQKIHHGNWNNSLGTGYAVRRYETALNRIEKDDSGFMINYEKAMHTDFRIDQPKKVICEIMPGFLKDNNLRIVYEALKVNLRGKNPIKKRRILPLLLSVCENGAREASTFIFILLL